MACNGANSDRTVTVTARVNFAHHPTPRSEPVSVPPIDPLGRTA